MKLAYALVAAFLAATSLAGTGVTEKRMTNYVAGVTTALSNNLQRAIEEATPENYEQVKTAALKSASTNQLNQAVEDLEEAIENATPADYANVSNLAVNAASKIELKQGVSNVMEFISADNDASEPTFNADGTITIVHIDQTLGYPRRIPVTLRASYTPYYATNHGFRVISSSWSGMTAGTLFVASTPSNFYNQAFGTLSYSKVIETNSQQNVIQYYRLYGSRYNVVFDSSNAYLTKQIQVVAYNGVASMSYLLGSFTVEPYYLSDTEFTQVAGSTPKGVTNAWVSAEAVTRELGFKYSWTQISPPVAVSAPAPARSRLPRLAAAPTEYYMNLPAYPNAPKYSWEEKYPDHDDDEYWEPEQWYLAEDWNDPYAWISFPVTVTIPYEYNGQTFTASKVCSSLAQLNKYFIVTIPPSPYKSPTLKKKKDYCKEGQHIYYNCKCSKCGKTRSHSYDAVAAGASLCAQCKNHNTSTKKDSHGDLMPDTDSGARCTHICDETVVAYHAGWHHEAYDQLELFNCSCQCGTYSTGKAHLQHTYSSEEDITEWHDAHDGQRHWGTVHCQRGNCDHEKDVFFNHVVEVEYDEETGRATNVEYYNSESHVIRGDCTKCTAKNLDHHLEDHAFVGVEAGEQYEWYDGETYTADICFCYCPICWGRTNWKSATGDENMHDIFYLSCGNIVNCIIGCARCNKLIAHNEHDFRTENHYDNETYHTCACGLHLHKHHKNETSEKCEGGYHWVAEYNDMGQEIGGEWVLAYSWVDDGCEHDWHEDPSHGTRDIPCDSGKGAPDVIPSGVKHVPQGSEKSNPSVTDPWRSHDQSCPFHTESIASGDWVIEWDDEVVIKWFKIKQGPFFVTGIYPIPVQWGTKYFAGSSTYKPKSFRVMRYATWVDWWEN